MEKEDKRGIFFGVIGVLTLIVAIIGASLAYFSINAKSEDNALTVKAATVKIVYEDGDKLNVTNIIPSDQTIALRTFTRTGDDDGQGGTYKTCIDDKGFTTCGYYDFTLTNDGPTEMEIIAKVIPTALVKEEKNEQGEVTPKGEIPFKHLKFVLYDRTGISGEFDNGSNIVYTGTIPYSEVSGEYTEFSLLGATGDETMKIAGNHTTKNLRLFVWLDEAGADNDAEQGATFKGTVNVEVKGAKTITGEATQ